MVARVPFAHYIHATIAILIMAALCASEHLIGPFFLKKNCERDKLCGESLFYPFLAKKHSIGHLK